MENLVPSAMRIAAVLLTWRDESAAITQFQKLARWPTVKPTVFLVRNASTGENIEAPCLTVIDEPVNRGYAGGINLALRLIDNQIDAVLLLNNDVSVDETTVRALVRHLERHPDIAVIGPVLDENGIICSGGRDPLRHLTSRMFAPMDPSGSTLRDVDYVPGTVLLFRRALLNQVGLLDERFFFSGEIADYCRRVRAAGWRCVIATDSQARHESNDHAGLRSTLYRYYTLRNRFLLARNQAGSRWPLWGIYWTALGFGMGLKALARDRKAARAVVWALIDGWKGNFGNRHDRFIP